MKAIFIMDETGSEEKIKIDTLPSIGDTVYIDGLTYLEGKVISIGHAYAKGKELCKYIHLKQK